MRKTYLWILACLTAAGLVGCGNESWSSGDRVLVAKCLYDSKLTSPNRFDVVVFKYPKEPTKKLVPYNYIKRLLGLPGEFFAIFLGRIYVWTPQSNEDSPAPDYDPKNDDAWERDLRDFPESHAKAMDRFRGGSFQIVRKPPEVLLAMRRIVYDNDFPARDLEGVIPPRWNPRAQSGWKADSRRGFAFAGDGKQTDWLRYQHYVRRPLLNPIGANMKPELIADILSYNTVPRSWNFHEFKAGAPRNPADIPGKSPRIAVLGRRFDSRSRSQRRGGTGRVPPGVEPWALPLSGTI
ncbi:MAG: S26 family signal peptidase [Gemmataceae bacterium]